MAAPLFQAVGPAEKANRKALTLDWPAHQQFDVAFLLIEASQGEVVTLATASGFVAVTGSPFTAVGAGTQLSVFWARASSGAMPKVVTSVPADHLYGVIVTVRGCAQSGDPWDAFAGGAKATASASLSVAGVTTLDADRLVLIAATKDLDAVAGFASGETNAALTGIAEDFDAGTTLGNGGGLMVMHGTKASAGAVGTTTITVTSSRNAYFAVALKPPVDVSVAVNGGQVSTSGGTVGPFVGSAQVNVTGASIQAQAGSSTPSTDVAVSLTGAQAATSPGAVTAATAVDAVLTGGQLQAQGGAADPVIDVRVTPSAGRATVHGASVGAVAAGTAALAGIQVAITPGTVTVTADVAVALQGVAAAVQAGTLLIAGSRDIAVALSGQELAAARNAVQVACHVAAAAAGGALVASAGAVDAQGTEAPASVSVDLVGAAIAASAGLVQAHTPSQDVRRAVASVLARPRVTVEIVDGLREAVTR